jgi:AGZA family xanthine/uracil permease-like MFS transporter
LQSEGISGGSNDLLDFRLRLIVANRERGEAKDRARWKLPDFPAQLFSAPDFGSVFLKLDIPGALKLAYVPSIVSLLFTDLFDSISTFIGVAQASKMLDSQGHPRNLKQGLIVDAFATLTAGLVGTSSGTAYVESAAGINVGLGNVALLQGHLTFPTHLI